MDPRFARFDDVKTFALADGVTNLATDVVERLANDRARIAMTCIDVTGVIRRHTFAEVATLAAQWAHLLRTHPLASGDRVAICVDRSPTWQAVVLGSIKAGVVPVPCPSELQAHEIAWRVGQSGARLVIAERTAEHRIDVMRGSSEFGADVLYLDDAQRLLSRCSRTAPTEETRWFEDALILFTSGLDESPRAVIHTHGYAHAAGRHAQVWLGAGPSDMVWSTGAAGSMAAVWHMLGAWSTGAGLAVIEGSHAPTEQLELATKLGVTILALRPEEYLALAISRVGRPATGGGLRHAISTGEPLDSSVIEEFFDLFGVAIHDGYGQTETTVLVANPHGAPPRIGSVGLPIPEHEIALLDHEGHAVGPFQEGEIAIRGHPPSLFSGYSSDPERTNAAFNAHHYMTGDRAWRDDDGYFWLSRPDDIIATGSALVDPVRVESALLRHPAVAESAVVECPGPEHGSTVKAFVVLRVGHDPSPFLADEIQVVAQERIARHESPQELEFVSDLPRTWTGKIRRDALRVRETAPSRVAYRSEHESGASSRAPDLAGVEVETRRSRASAAQESQAKTSAMPATGIVGESASHWRSGTETIDTLLPAGNEGLEGQLVDEHAFPSPESSTLPSDPAAAGIDGHPTEDADGRSSAERDEDERHIEQTERLRRSGRRAREEERARLSDTRSWLDSDEDTPRAGGTLAERLSKYGMASDARIGTDAAA